MARSARGNTSLESAVSLTKSLRWDIQGLGQRIAAVVNESELSRSTGTKIKTRSSNEGEVKRIVGEIKGLLNRIEDAVPLINLAITTSGANLSSALPATVSPSRLLQASTFLTAGDSQYSALRTRTVQIGPTFTLSLYMLFAGHIRPQNEVEVRETTWKEVLHKARLKLLRVPVDDLYTLPDSISGSSIPVGNASEPTTFPAELRSDEYAYQIVIIEDLDDDRAHTFEDDEAQPSAFQDIAQAGIREVVPVHEISKIFYADTGKILNISSDGETNNPILLLKRDVQAVPPRRMMQRFDDVQDQPIESIEQPLDGARDQTRDQRADNQSQTYPHLDREHRVSPAPQEEHIQVPDPWRIPPNVDPEWLAFEVYTESEDSDTESEPEEASFLQTAPSRAQSLDPALTNGLSNLRVHSSPSPSSGVNYSQSTQLISLPVAPSLPIIRTSLSLLETILRLLSLQQFQQMSHLSIPDELLNFFLSEAATTGAASGDDVARRRRRNEARQRVGFDPYDESPIKRRGEEYQYRGGTSQSGEGLNGNMGDWAFVDDSYAEQWRTSRAYGSPTPGSEEGYNIHHFSDDPSFSDPRSPQLLLANKAHRSRSNTPDRNSLPPFPRSSGSSGGRDGRRTSLPTVSNTSPRTPPPLMTGASRFKLFQRETRKGSPLARPGSGATEGTLAISSSEGNRNEEK